MYNWPVSETLPSASEIGAVLPGFRIERQIGHGGMSAVYLAEDLGPLQRKRVAIKVLAPGLATDEHFRTRFVRESQIVANLEHPNVIPVYDAGTAGSLLYLVMRYVEGPDLRALLRQEGPLAPGRVASLISQVAGALDAAHRQGLVHRDVKPANVMVDRPGLPDEHCYLCDFGITKQAQSAETLTGTGQFVGTLDYIAPEQIEGRPLDPRTDVYALGCVVYQCLTGSVPYPLETDMAKMLAHVREPTPSVRDVRSDVPPAVDDVIAKAMAKDPAERFASCGELAAALRAATSGSVASGTAPSAALSETRDALRVPALEEQDPRSSGAARRARLPVPVPVLAAGAGAVALIIVLVLVLGGGSGFPNRKENALLAGVPVGERGSCRRAPGPPAGATAFIRCKAKGGASTYTLAAYRTRAATDGAFTTSVKASPVPEGQHTGDCAEFSEEVHPFSNTKGQKGQILCYRRGTAESVIVWTDPVSPVLGRVTRPDDKDAVQYEWWVAFVDRPESDTFPDSKEKALLDRLPDAVRSTCDRTDLAHENQLASVVCTPADGPPQVFYTSFGDKGALQSVYDATLNDAGVARDTGDTDACPAEAAYVYSSNNAEGGRRVCFFKGTTAHLLWTETEQLVLIEAVHTGGDFASMYAWAHSGVGQP